MKWDINLQNIQDEYTMLTTIFILIIAKLIGGVYQYEN